MKMNMVDWLALVLVIVGGINWGLVGFFSFDLVATIFSFAPIVARVVYCVVGVAAVYTLYTAMKMRKA
jgi:uncharacterized membrane protein YuzA (DUF378 family)